MENAHCQQHKLLGSNSKLLCKSMDSACLFIVLLEYISILTTIACHYALG